MIASEQKRNALKTMSHPDLGTSSNLLSLLLKKLKYPGESARGGDSSVKANYSNALTIKITSYCVSASSY
jgi:hypothetical protein